MRLATKPPLTVTIITTTMPVDSLPLVLRYGFNDSCVLGLSFFISEWDRCEGGSRHGSPSLQYSISWPSLPAKRSLSSRYTPFHTLKANKITDIIEECLTLFRANCLFRNFEIKGPADRTLIYGILFISDCLNKLGSRVSLNQQDAVKALNALALENFNIPGEPGFPLNPLYPAPAGRLDAGNSPFAQDVDWQLDLLKQYLTQFRQELAQRLIGRLYADNTNAPSKWWMSFKRRLFMNKSLS